jgi:hypothetical protein
MMTRKLTFSAISALMVLVLSTTACMKETNDHLDGMDTHARNMAKQAELMTTEASESREIFSKIALILEKMDSHMEHFDQYAAELFALINTALEKRKPAAKTKDLDEILDGPSGTTQGQKGETN